jgi:hypothetical protein
LSHIPYVPHSFLLNLLIITFIYYFSPSFFYFTVGINKAIIKRVRHAIQINKTSLRHLIVWVSEILFLFWFSKELKMTYWRTTDFVTSSLYFLLTNEYSLGGGFSFPIVLVPRYKLYLCHTPIKPNLLGFSKNLYLYVWVAWPRVQEVRITFKPPPPSSL